MTAASAVVDEIVFDGAAGAAVAKQLVGRAVVGAGRKGKYFWFEFDQGPCLLMHFGMTGQGHLRGVAAPQYKVKMGETRAPEEWPPRFLKLELVFDDGKRWAYTDPRRLGRIRLVNDPPKEPPVSLLGFDPLLAMPTLPEFKQWLAGRTAPIKAVLLDQGVAAGVGNWIADEVLYQAEVHPEVSTAVLSDAELAALHAALDRIIRVAVACKTANEDNPADWLFHYRWTKGAKAAKDHHGNAISFVTVGGRTSAVVLARQKFRKGVATQEARKRTQETTQGRAQVQETTQGRARVHETGGRARVHETGGRAKETTGGRAAAVKAKLPRGRAAAAAVQALADAVDATVARSSSGKRTPTTIVSPAATTSARTRSSRKPAELSAPAAPPVRTQRVAKAAAAAQSRPGRRSTGAAGKA